MLETSQTPKNRRSARDFRARNAKVVLLSVFHSQREAPRRACDRRRTFFVDRHRPQVIIPALGIALLSAIDGQLTIYLLSQGASELNPVMALLIGLDTTLFFYVKYVVTCLGSVMLVMLAYYRPSPNSGMPVQRCTLALALLYMGVVSYEVALLTS